MRINYIFFFFFFNDTATTEIYTLSLHDALPIRRPHAGNAARPKPPRRRAGRVRRDRRLGHVRGPAPRPGIGDLRNGRPDSDRRATRAERVAVRPGPVRTVPLERADERT